MKYTVYPWVNLSHIDFDLNQNKIWRKVLLHLLHSIFVFLRQNNLKKLLGSVLSIVGLTVYYLTPDYVHATQLHSGSEGIIVHQLGHVFFLVSMVILFFAIQGKKLHKERCWRLIQFSALFFVLWNLDALVVHFLDNQIQVIHVEIISFFEMEITPLNDNTGLALFYYFIRLDHLFCLPAMFFLYKGLKAFADREVS